ncbi:zinc finger CCCH domain-containing protein 34 [Malania oleifera]|uniref:zinc finger CCCH domain-containing protein 34 n=1 Tax=Malania oleifera TaxID=397392 RepID=UPI0025ADEB21|nr:zinc finger CCCH domain-containing protein 34 [Malania oleifera]
MERYGRGSATEGSQPDPPPKWSSLPAETGLEEPVWQLGLGGGDSYPERPGEADCIYYLRTGLCGYGARCRFNHPRERTMAVGAGRAGGGGYPERVGQPVCKFYMRTGTCKFGTSCKYHHPRQGGGPVSPVLLNYLGYPLRPGEKDCSFYIRTGECKFGISCKFHHPQPADVQMPAPMPAPAASPVPAAVPPAALYPSVQPPSGPSSQQYGFVPGVWQVPRSPVVPGSYVQGPYGHVLLPPGIVSIPSLSPYPAPLSPVASPSTQPSAGAFYGVAQFSPSAPAYTGSYTPMPSLGPLIDFPKEHTFPERPGQPECQYYMKTGDCKYGSSCRYHHPAEWNALKADCSFSPAGLPLRPGTALCAYYAQHGMCKFGRTCKFDHPVGTLSYSPSASSLADMPVAPYPVGSSVGTLAPSSSSSDLRPELISGSNMDSLSTRMASSTSTTSGSVGSILSKSAPAPHSTVQQSGQSTTPTIGHSSMAQEGKVFHSMDVNAGMIP